MERADEAAKHIVDFYAAFDEGSRLDGAFGQFEEERTRELMLRFLGQGRLRIVDSGGGTGRYSRWLSGLGHSVTLVDLIPSHVAAARDSCLAAGLDVDCRLGDARSMDLPDDSADVLISHGPLYHLVDRLERQRSLEEARRVLRKGGYFLGFTITRYAGINYALRSGQVYGDEYFALMGKEVKTGLCNNLDGRIRTFNLAHFHLPDEIRAEVEEAGLVFIRNLGVLGSAWMVPDLESAWHDDERRARLLEAARLLEDEPVLGPRILTVAQKP